jgi:Zn-dependent protease
MSENDASRRAREIENLRAVYESLRTPEKKSERRPGPTRQVGRNVAWGAAASALVLVASKAKFLGFLAGALKLKTLATMLLSIGVYAVEWGLPFAFGFVLLIFVHELGHAVALRREGIAAGAPVFIPFVGAFIAMRGRPRDAYVEATVGIAGPVLGSLAAWLVLGTGLAMQQPLLVALGHTAVLLNLFNLIPVPPLDGGRIAGAFTPIDWLVGYAAGVVALLVTRSPLLLIVLALGLWTLVQRWRHPVPGYDAVPRARRLAMALGYAALVTGLLATLPLGAETSLGSR